MASRASLALAVPLLVKALASAALMASGFVAVSDDDYARLVIAQEFAESPKIDPSGTSWLPAPFWVYGLALRIFGVGIGVGRATAFVCGVASIGLVFVAARWLGASHRGASIGATLAALVPHSVWLGAAMVPELPTAACIVLGMAAARATCPWRILGGAAALLFATLSRYEAWPVAAAFSLLVIWDGLRQRSFVRVMLGAVASVGILAWLLHGAFVHHDTLFFVHRVANYRNALAGEATPSLWNALRPAFGLFLAEPELVVGIAVAGLLTWRRDDARFREGLVALRRPLVLGAALIAFLTLGAAFGGEATHHEERPLLALWLFGAVLAGGWLDEVSAAALLARSRRSFGVGVPCVALVVLSRMFYPHDSFSPREDERAAGASARELVPAGEHVLIDTVDYGYFAVIAAFGAPSRADVLRKHDPRERAAGDLDIDSAVRQHGANTAIVDVRANGAAETGALGPVLRRHRSLVVIRLRGSAGQLR